MCDEHLYSSQLPVVSALLLSHEVFVSRADCGDMKTDLQIWGEILARFPFLEYSQPLRHSTHSPQSLWSALCMDPQYRWLRSDWLCISAYANPKHRDTMSDV